MGTNWREVGERSVERSDRLRPSVIPLTTDCPSPLEGIVRPSYCNAAADVSSDGVWRQAAHCTGVSALFIAVIDVVSVDVAAYDCTIGTG